MARVCKQRPAKESIAVVVDGKDEKWYFEKVKAHYPCNALRFIKIKPELPRKKKVQELFDFAHQKLDEEYTFVILLFDMDVPLKDNTEFNKFKELYEKYLGVKGKTLVGRQRIKYAWMEKLLVIINNPCLEFWYLLHFGRTSKYYADYENLRSDLRKIPEMSQYEKSEAYYNHYPDIYVRLDRNNGLANARINASPFNIERSREEGCSEMSQVFDHFDRLK